MTDKELGGRSHDALIAARTRNKILAGKEVTIPVPYEGETTDVFIAFQQRQIWPQVLGAFAATYSQKFDLSTPTKASDAVLDKIKGQVYRKTILYDSIEANLATNLNYAAINIGDNVSFSGSGDLSIWAEKETEEKFATEQPHEVTAELTSTFLTKRGIETLKISGTYMANLLTERLLQDDRLQLSAEEMRIIVREQGHHLLTPLMASDTTFTEYRPIFSDFNIAAWRESIIELANKYVDYDLTNAQVSNVRLKIDTAPKTGEFGCPFMHAKPHKLVKPSWKIIVDTMWDDFLKPKLDGKDVFMGEL